MFQYSNDKHNSTSEALHAGLYVVSTPIGNLEDITIRALKTLNNVDIIICEDSRVTAKLLNHYEIKDKKLIIYNDHAKIETHLQILNYINNGKALALVSDAGTPLISDPGFKLLRFLQENSVKITPIGGISAITTAISVSSLACDNFLFLGFLPPSKISALNFLKTLPQNYSLVFFESPHRIIDCLDNFMIVFADRKISLMRELTKFYEEIIVDEPSKIKEILLNHPEKIRGEFVLVVEKLDKKNENIDWEEIDELIAKNLATGLSIRDIADAISQSFNLNRKIIYQRIINNSNSISE
jgi:16S rRNA (cytidine1402-2'-O)-methyltransferase